MLQLARVTVDPAKRAELEAAYRTYAASLADEPGTLLWELAADADDAGVVWMLDNGRRGEEMPKIVAWDTKKDQLHKVIYLPKPATIPTSSSGACIAGDRARQVSSGGAGCHHSAAARQGGGARGRKRTDRGATGRRSDGPSGDDVRRRRRRRR